MTTRNGDPTPDPAMHFAAIRYSRLFPPPADSSIDYEGGVAFYLSCEETKLDYLLSVTKDDARRLAEDLSHFFAGEINIRDPDDNYGQPR